MQKSSYSELEYIYNESVASFLTNPISVINLGHEEVITHTYTPDTQDIYMTEIIKHHAPPLV